MGEKYRFTEKDIAIGEEFLGLMARKLAKKLIKYNVINPGAIGKKPGVYFIFREQKIRYVGKTNNFERRFIQHKKTGILDPETDGVMVLIIHDENERSMTEELMIGYLEPPQNVQMNIQRKFNFERLFDKYFIPHCSDVGLRCRFVGSKVVVYD